MLSVIPFKFSLECSRIRSQQVQHYLFTRSWIFFLCLHQTFFAQRTIVNHQSTWVQRIGLCPTQGTLFILWFSFPFNFKRSGKSRNRFFFFSFKRSTDGRSSWRPLTLGNQLLYMDHDEVGSHNFFCKIVLFQREFFHGVSSCFSFVFLYF